MRLRFITTLLFAGTLWTAAFGAECAPWTRRGDEVRAALSSPDVVVRREASAHLSQLDGSAARTLTLVALRDSDSVVRLHALDAAARVGLSESRRFALQWLSDPDPRLRRAAARLIADMPDASDAQTLGRTLSDGDPTVRALAAEALGRTGSEVAIPALLGQLDDQQPRVRIAITRALGRLGDRRAVAALMGRLHDPDGLVREAAAAALSEIGDERAIGPVALALSDSEPGARAAAATALGRLDAVSTVAELESLSASDPDAGVRAAAFIAMGRFRSASSNAALMRALTRLAPLASGADRDALMQGFIAAGPSAEKRLEECLGEGSPRSALCARAWAGAAPGTAAGPIAEALVAGNVPPAAALDLLESLASPDAVPAVMQQLERGNASERARAILVLDAVVRRHGPDGRIAQPVAAVLERAPSAVERAALIRLLGRAGNASVAESVVSFTSARWPRLVRRAAYGALRDLYLAEPGERGRTAAADAGLDAVLLSGLDEPDPEVRRAAALAATDVGGAALVEPVMARYSDSTPSQRLLLAAALRSALASASGDQLRQSIRMLDAAKGRVRDAWIESLAPIPVAARLLATRPLDGADRAKLAEGLDPEQIELLEVLAADEAARVRANAIWRIGAFPSGSRIAPLVEALDDPDPGVSANAIAGVARVAAATGDALAPEQQTVALAALCDALADPRSAVRQNAAAGLLLLDATCQRDLLEQLLRRDPSARVRVLVAQLVRGDGEASDRTSLLACARDDTSSEVRRACQSLAEQGSRLPASSGPRPTAPVLVDVVPASGESVVGSAPFGLRFDNGLVRYGLADRRGRIREPHAPRGTVTLTVPASYRRD